MPITFYKDSALVLNSNIRDQESLFFSKNLKPAIDQKCLLSKKLHDEFILGWILGPFKKRPITNLRINPVGLVPKQNGAFSFHTHQAKYKWIYRSWILPCSIFTIRKCSKKSSRNRGFYFYGKSWHLIYALYGQVILIY